jgi:hypothetical protein
MIKDKFNVDSGLKKEKPIKEVIQKPKEIKTEEHQRSDAQKVYHFCYNYYKQYNKFPKLIKIVNNTKLTYKQIKIILQLLISKKYIKRIGNNYYFPDQKVTRKKKKKPIKKVEKKVTLEKVKLYILFTFLGIIGLIATVMSIHYTTLWFLSITNTIISFALSICMVGFSVVAFEVIILLKQNRSYIIAFIFSILWGIVLIFSMSSTIAGLYNQNRDKQIINIKETNDNTHLYYQELINQENSIKTDIEDKIKERKRYINILQEFDTDEKIKENEKQINKYRNTVYYLDRDIKRLKISLNKIREEKKKLLSDNKNIKNVEKEDFFIWASRIIKVKAFIIQFCLYTFPAVFIDIIAPLSFAIILFYKKKDKLSKKVL